MAFHWSEYRAGIGEAPNYSIAGRSSRPAASRGGAIASVVSAASTGLNRMAFDHSLEREKEKLRYAIERMFQGHQHGGALAVAEVQNTRHGTMDGKLLNYLSLEPGIFARPEHAISVWRRKDRLSAGHNPLSYRFFWITR
ncbi:MAG: hypothetical protein ACJA06_000493 [Halocynthiibacter sp.]|jgi:hypothetical protein